MLNLLRMEQICQAARARGANDGLEFVFKNIGQIPADSEVIFSENIKFDKEDVILSPTESGYQVTDELQPTKLFLLQD